MTTLKYVDSVNIKLRYKINELGFGMMINHSTLTRFNTFLRCNGSDGKFKTLTL